MKYLYLDEAGDMGFKKKSSKFYTIAILIPKYDHRIERLIKSFRKSIFKVKEKKKIEIKFHDSLEMHRVYFLEKLNLENIKIYSLTLNKERVYSNLREFKDNLNKFLTKNLLHKIPFYSNEALTLVVDKFLSSGGIELYDSYILHNLPKNVVEMKILHLNSSVCPCLQATDFIVGAIFQKYENGNLKYFDIIKEKILIDETYLPSKKKVNPPYPVPSVSTRHHSFRRTYSPITTTNFPI